MDSVPHVVDTKARRRYAHNGRGLRPVVIPLTLFDTRRGLPFTGQWCTPFCASFLRLTNIHVE